MLHCLEQERMPMSSFKLELVYDDYSKEFEKLAKESAIECKSYKEGSKEAYSLKSYYAAKQVPFAALSYGDNCLKAFYTEDSSCTIDNIFTYIESYVDFNAYKCNIKLVKVLDNREEPIITGYTKTLMEGVRCYISNPDEWYMTSIVKHINLENKIFTTLNSTYKFEIINEN